MAIDLEKAEHVTFPLDGELLKAVHYYKAIYRTKDPIKLIYNELIEDAITKKFKELKDPYFTKKQPA